MGGKYGRPGIATADNVVRVVKAKGETMIRLNADIETLLTLVQVGAIGKAMLTLASWRWTAKFQDSQGSP
jgi:hypothetical protein